MVLPEGKTVISDWSVGTFDVLHEFCYHIVQTVTSPTKRQLLKWH